MTKLSELVPACFANGVPFPVNSILPSVHLTFPRVTNTSVALVREVQLSEVKVEASVKFVYHIISKSESDNTKVITTIG